MGQQYRLSKVPYAWKDAIGRPSWVIPQGFISAWEIDISRRDTTKTTTTARLPPDGYRRLVLAGSNSGNSSRGNNTRPRSTPDSVGIGHYAIDFPIPA